ncbi:MAG: riboflavin synthase [Gemmatimonadota bacterium]
MFTGIVEAVGEVTRLEPRGREGRRMSLRAPGLVASLALGDSVAVDGACLTVETLSEDGFTVTAVEATLARTILGGYREGSGVNLERAARLGDRMDGHLVQGHVDGVGTLQEVGGGEASRVLRFRIPAAIWRQTVSQGSIAINGVSLTVQRLLPPDEVEIAIIPFTAQHTNLGRLEPGARVNVEGDLIAKYVGRMLAPHTGAAAEPDPARPAGDPEEERT